MVMTPFLLWALGGALPAAFLCWAIYSRGIRPRLNIFRSSGAVLEVNHPNHVLRVQLGDALEASVKLGRCHIAFRNGASPPGKDAPNGPTRIIIYELDVPSYFHQKWARHPSVTLTSTETWVASFDMRRDVTALQRWINAHSDALFPNEHTIRQAWEQSCDKLLTACRQVALLQKFNTRLELFDYSTDPAIRYLAIGEDGRACLKTLEHTEFHKLDLRDLQLDRRRLWVALPNGEKEHFTFSGDQLARLHRIRLAWQRRYGSLPGLRTHLSGYRPLAGALIGIRQRDVACYAA